MIPEKENENFNASSTIKQITTIAGAVLALNAIALVGHGARKRWRISRRGGRARLTLALLWRGRSPIVG